MINNLFSTLLNFIFPPSCFGCKKATTPLCDTCLMKCRKPISSPYPFIVSLYSFKESLIRKSVHASKYFHRKDLLLPFAKKLADELVRQNLQGTLTPIPMPRLRKLLRGYNQAEELAKSISVLCARPYSTKILTRALYSDRQVTVRKRSSRIDNQKNAFKVSVSVTNQDFVLIDDVTTTGATLLSARRALLEAGARNVQAITIAH